MHSSSDLKNKNHPALWDNEIDVNLFSDVFFKIGVHESLNKPTFAQSYFWVKFPQLKWSKPGLPSTFGAKDICLMCPHLKVAFLMCVSFHLTFFLSHSYIRNLTPTLSIHTIVSTELFINFFVWNQPQQTQTLVILFLGFQALPVQLRFCFNVCIALSDFKSLEDSIHHRHPPPPPDGENHRPTCLVLGFRANFCDWSMIINLVFCFFWEKPGQVKNISDEDVSHSKSTARLAILDFFKQQGSCIDTEILQVTGIYKKFGNCNFRWFHPIPSPRFVEKRGYQYSTPGWMCSNRIQSDLVLRRKRQGRRRYNE